jgi:hypothetical protein
MVPNIIAAALNMSRFTTFSKHLRIDNDMIDAVLEGKMAPTGYMILFGGESPPGNNLEDEINQFSLEANLKLKARNVSDKAHIILKLLIRMIRRKGKLKFLEVIEEYWKFMASYFIRSFCSNQLIHSKSGLTEPSPISYISQDIVLRKRYYNLEDNSNQLFDVAAVIVHNAQRATGARNDIYILRSLFNHIILDGSMLTVLLNSTLQLFYCWTTLQYAIQTLIIIFTHVLLRVYNLFKNKSWPAIQGSFFFFP